MESLNNIYFSTEFTDFQSFSQSFQNQKIVVLVDENTAKYCYPKIKDFLPQHFLIEIASGEENKNLQTCTYIWQQLTDYQLDRKSVLINLGGGVIGDMGGFCAATYKRGIDFIQMPTTLLSQVDASVGGKLGVDFQGLKNHIGVFQEPKAVWIFPDFIQSLSRREVRSGFAEIIKHCLIADKVKWQELVQSSKFKVQNSNPEFSIDNELLSIDLIRHSVEIKAKVVEADPTEKGLRKILNFGHTLGHAVESFYLPKPTQRLLHGEAIAVGMICEAYLSWQKGFLKEKDLQEINQFILNVYGKVDLQSTDFQSIINLTYQDKKNQDNQVQFSLLEGIGKSIFNQIIGEAEMQEALKFYQQL